LAGCIELQIAAFLHVEQEFGGEQRMTVCTPM